MPHFQIDVLFCSNRKISVLNGEWREKMKPTDILSFPANDFESPGVFADDPTLEFQKHLGDLVVAPQYVMKQCKLDKEDFEVCLPTIFTISIDFYMMISIPSYFIKVFSFIFAPLGW